MPEAGAGKGKVAQDVSPGADLHYFLRVEGVTKDWVELDGFSLGFAQSGTIGGTKAGRVTADDVAVSLGSSQSVAKLVEYAGTGKHITDIEVVAAEVGGKGFQAVDSFKFSDVLVTSLQDGSGGSQIAFDYVKLGRSHFTYDETGKLDDEERAGFDFKLNKATGDGGGVLPNTVKLDDVAHDLDYYVRFDGIGSSGEWLRLDSFSMGLSVPTTTAGGGVSGVGRATAEDVALLLGSSEQLVQLMNMLDKGQHIKTAEIEAYSHGGERQLVDEFRFDDVLLTSLDTSNGSSNALAFDFAKFSHGHQDYDNDGSKGTAVSEGFDFSLNKAFDGPAPHADIGFF